MVGAILSFLCILTHLLFTTNLWGMEYYLHFYRLGKRDPERLSDLLKVIHLVSGEAGIQAWGGWLQSL